MDDYVRLSFEDRIAEGARRRSGDGAAAPASRICCSARLEERRTPLERQLRLLDAEIESNGPVNMNSDVWRQSDPQGIGASRAATVLQMPEH